MTWAILIWCAIGLYEWWRLIRKMLWVSWVHLALVVVFMLLGPITTACIRFDEWQDRKRNNL